MAFHALWNTRSFDRAEKDARDTGDKIKKLGGPLFNITYPNFTYHTITFMYAFYGLFALTVHFIQHSYLH